MPGSPCEDRLRRAYAYDTARGGILRAVDGAFAACGVSVLAVEEDAVGGYNVVPLVELPLTSRTQAQDLARLAPCMERFWADNADAAWMAGMDWLQLRIVPERASGPATPPAPLTSEARIPTGRHAEPAWSITLARGRSLPEPADLRFRPFRELKSRIDAAMAEAARRFLRGEPGGGHVQRVAFAVQMRLDPEHVDVVRGYIMACSAHTPGTGPCREDLAIAMRYDITTGEASELMLLRDIRDARGRVVLPPLPGR